MQKIFYLIFLSLLLNPAWSKVYRWVDENGKVVFSQLPPPAQVQAEEIEIKAPPPASNPAPKAEPKAEEKPKNPALDSELKKEYCEKAEQALRLLEEAEEAGISYFVDENKQVIKLEGKALREKKQQAEFLKKTYCE